MPYETGYLTHIEPIVKTDCVHLGCPNAEITEAYSNLLAQRLYHDDGRFNLGFIKHTKEILASCDAEQIADYLNSLFATLPYHNYPVTEESMVAALVNFNIKGALIDEQSEFAQSTGRADAIINFPNLKLTLVFEINGRAMGGGVTNKVFLQKVIKLICLYFKLLIFMKSLKFDLLVTLSSGHHVVR